MSRAKSVLIAALISALMLAAGALPALASDHLANASQQGQNQASASGKDPADIPGEGNPNAGNERGTPAVDKK